MASQVQVRQLLSDPKQAAMPGSHLSALAEPVRYQATGSSAQAQETDSRADFCHPLDVNRPEDNNAARHHHHQQQQPSAVMGIFFKVWSLVKVSKGRSQAHKIRRETSAEPGQLQNITSWPLDEQLDAAGGSITRLQDGHFRRAGSQPAPSTRTRANQANLLQVIGATGSTSSGVSSATSVDGTNSSSPGRSNAPPSSVRRHLSAYSLRRSTADAPLSAPTSEPSNSNFQRAGKERSLSSSASSWASRIKRSATTVNQADLSSYVSRYKLKRSPEQPEVRRPAPPPVPPQSVRLVSRASIPPMSSGERSDGPGRHRAPTTSASTGSISDEEDSNDIYSTPHDSIQSVPSTAPVLSMNERLAPTVHQVTSQAYPIVKSFSTSNFSHLLAGSAKQVNQFKPIAELDTKDPAESSGKPKQIASNLRPLANSRFFISSSSSEDSTSGQHQRRPQPVGSGVNRTASMELEQERSESGPMQLELRNRLPLAVVQGTHYHAAARPDSLILAHPARLGAGPLMSPLDWAAPSPFARRQSRLIRPVDVQSSKGAGALAAHNLTHLQPAMVRSASPVVAPSDARRSRQSENLASLDLSFERARPTGSTMPNSISLYDCKTTSHDPQTDPEYKLASMLLEFGSNRSAKDDAGNTTLMQACLSDSIPAIRCLIERGVDLNETNKEGLAAIDLVCARLPSSRRLSILHLLVDSGADLDRIGPDGLRLLDRLATEHQPMKNNKLPFIDCLLRNGAKLGSSTWAAAFGKHDIQLRLLKKLCHDGYFLYKQSSIEAAVYRFEYGLRRITELEQQLAQGVPGSSWSQRSFYQQQVSSSARLIKFQTFLGLSRCERKRKFYKRALEFAHMAILVDSTAYEGFYSKANILKDLGETDEALLAVNQTSQLVEKSIELGKGELHELELQYEESFMLASGLEDLTQEAACSTPTIDQLGTGGWKRELEDYLDYLEEARKHVRRLRGQILDDKLRLAGENELPVPAADECGEIVTQTRC